MRTTELFKFNRSSKRINESFEKTFGKKLKLETFSIEQLEDARNKLRTQIHTVRSESNFNETVENDALTKAQFMHDAIVAELAERNEPIVDHSEPVIEGPSPAVEEFLSKVAQEGDYDMLYDAQMGKYGPEIERVVQNMYDDVSVDAGLHGDDDFEAIYDRMLDNIEADYGVSDNESFSFEEKFDPLKHVKNPTPGEKKAAKDVKRGSYADRAAMLRSAEADGRLKKESAPPTAKGERMVKHIKKGYADDGKLTDKEKSIAYATAWKQHNKEKNESVETGDDMTRLQEGEIQQASAIVTAKTMVDRVGRWIEELSGMENDTLLQLGDSIRDEMGQEQAKGFIEAVAPAIQQALENLKTTREALASGVRTLTGEEQSAGMLGAEPAAGGDEMDMGDEMGGEAEPDAMNAEPTDDFAAAEPATGGGEAAGRAQRESIDRGNSLLKVLAG